MSAVSDRAIQAARLREQYSDGRNLNARIELHRRFSTNHYGFARWVFDQLALAPGATVLELGCGTGLFWRSNAARVPARWRLTLTDFSFGMLQEARTGLGAIGDRFALAQVDAESLPFASGSFDAVIANHMLYHVHDRDRAISEIRRVLNADGIAFTATNGRAHLRELDEMVERFIPGRSIASHVERFGLETGEPQLRRHFGQVDLRRYEDSLVVTEAQPILDYVTSVGTRGAMTPQALESLRGFLDGELRAKGSIRISKDAGLLISRP